MDFELMREIAAVAVLVAMYWVVRRYYGRGEVSSR